MIKKLFLTLCLLALCSPSFAGGITDKHKSVIAGQMVAAAGKTYLLQDDFDDTDGVNLKAHTADLPASVWTGYDGDDIEIDTGQKQAGTASVKCNGTDDSITYKTWASGQSAGKHTYDFYFRYDQELDVHGVIVFSKGVYAWGDNNWVTLIQHNPTGELQYYSGDTWNNIGSSVLDDDIWFHIEIELDMDANTLDVWVDGTKRLTDGAFQNSGGGVEPLDTFNLTDGTASDDMWIDELGVYTGARTP